MFHVQWLDFKIEGPMMSFKSHFVDKKRYFVSALGPKNADTNVIFKIFKPIKNMENDFISEQNSKLSLS